jgi:hypothetical protein
MNMVGPRAAIAPAYRRARSSLGALLVGVGLRLIVGGSLGNP